MVERVLIMGAGGRDFHNFNLCYRNNQRYQVMGFTATQIPDIEGRRYPSELSGERYPRGLPIWPESALQDLIREQSVDQVVFSYSDVPYTQVMSKAAQATAAGADFIILGPSSTMLRSSRPVIAVCAVRTGCGKSQTSRAIYGILAKHDLHAVLVRHPMAYGDLARQAVQRLASLEDLNREACTLEEREEFEPILEMGGVVFAGVDYEKVLRRAEQEAELRETIEAVPCDLIVVATPVDLGRVLVLDRPAVRVSYDYKDHGQPSLEEALLAALRERNVWGLRI